MKDEFINFFVDIAQQKLKLKYSIVKMILHTLPHVRPNWKEFKQANEAFSLEDSMKKYPGIEVREHRFIDFIEHGNLTDEDMRLIMDLQKSIDSKNLNREYAYTEEELRYYLRSRLIRRMVLKLDKTELLPEESIHSAQAILPIPEFN